MHLVDEQDRADAGNRERVTRLVDHRPYVLDTGGDRGQFTEPAPTGAGDDVRERRLTAARRPPEQDRGGAAAFHQAPQRTARAEQVALPDEIVEGPGTQPGREGTRRREGLLEPGVEQAHLRTV